MINKTNTLGYEIYLGTFLHINDKLRVLDWNYCYQAIPKYVMLMT